MFFTAVKPDGELTDTPPSYFPKQWQWSNFTTLSQPQRRCGMGLLPLLTHHRDHARRPSFVMVVAVPAAYYVGPPPLQLPHGASAADHHHPDDPADIARRRRDPHLCRHRELEHGHHLGRRLRRPDPRQQRLQFDLRRVDPAWGFFAAIPAEIEEAAWMDGASAGSPRCARSRCRSPSPGSSPA